MQVYEYSLATGEYVGSRTAQRDQRGDGFLIPAGCTDLAPPSYQTGQVAMWRGGSWEVVTDMRGTVYWTAPRVENKITEIEGFVPQDATVTPPSSDYQVWNESEWVEDTERKIADFANLIRSSRDCRMLCALDATGKYTTQQALIASGGTVASPITEQEYISVLQYIEDLRNIPQQPGFPWNGPDDVACPWPTKPACVCDMSITE